MLKLMNLFATIVVILVLHCLDLSAITVQLDSDSSALAEGELQKRAKAIRHLFRLDLDGSNIGIDRNWGPVNRSEMLAKETEKLIQRGMNERIAARLAEQLVPGGFQSHPLIHSFSQVRSAQGSYSQSGSTRKWNMSFRGSKLSGDLKFNSDAVMIRIRERNGDKRTIVLEDQNNKEFVIRYEGPDFSVQLKQEQDGNIEMVRDWDGKKEVFKASDFGKFQQQHARLVNSWLIPVLEHAGFDMPITITSPATKKAVLERLVILQQRSDQEFLQLLKELDHDNFSKRDRATRLLRDQLDIWTDQIKQTLNSKTLSAEARNRLEILLLKSAKRNSIDDLVQNNKLLEKPDYLVSLFGMANDQEVDALNRQLQFLTGQEFSTAEDWSQFIRKSQ